MPTIIVPQLNTFSKSLTQMGGFAVHAGTNAMTGLGGIALQRGISAYRNINSKLIIMLDPRSLSHEVQHQSLICHETSIALFDALIFLNLYNSLSFI